MTASQDWRGPQAPPGPDRNCGQTLRLDVITIFPGYLRALDLSLVGKAAGAGLLDLQVHDLRRWTRDRHRSVDDTPLGGGAGMVMKPDVWGEALDEVLRLPADAQRARRELRDRPERQVLVIPTPAGEVFTQHTAEDLGGADQIVFACGRYEGIDARVARHYREAGVEVRELSIGDYVLNGGEVAALVIIEAVARLRPGVLGNPESVVEESHAATGLLEHEVHTRPVRWRGLDVAREWPALLSGDHGLIARERRDRALARTARLRPDLVRRLDPSGLDPADRAALARLGWASPPGAGAPVKLIVRPALTGDVPALAELAARTFPDACPPFLSSESVSRHVEDRLNPQILLQWVEDPRVAVTVAQLGEETTTCSGQVRPDELVGYSVVVAHEEDDSGGLPAGLDPLPPAVATLLEDGPAPGGDGGANVEDGAGGAAELSKLYVDARVRESGLAAALLSNCVRQAARMGAQVLWLGTHEGNRPARKAYRRAGFTKVGSRTYDVGGRRCRDVVMALDPRAHDQAGPQR